MAKRKSNSFNFLKKQKREKSKIKMKSFCAPHPTPPHTQTPGFSRKRVGLAENFAAILEHWNTLGNWKSLGSNYCRIPDVWVRYDSNEEEKGIDTVRGYKMSKRVYRSAVKSVLLSVIGSIFWQPIWGGNVNFMGHFFSWRWKILQGRALE